MEAIQKLSIIGTGNAGFHLAKALTSKGITVSHVYGRNKETVQAFKELFGSSIVEKPNDLPIDHTILLCVSDDSIAHLLNELNPHYAIAYTSGAVNIDSLPHRERLGVFYPLQTFSKNIELDYSSIPFFIESNNELFQNKLFELASSISNSVTLADSKQRENLHLSAVWVNNFTNHILFQAQEIAKKNNVDFNHLVPLLEETINKLKFKSPFDAQTGPARRGDYKTIEHQLSKLNDDQKKIYQLITDSIINTYKND